MEKTICDYPRTAPYPYPSIRVLNNSSDLWKIVNSGKTGGFSCVRTLPLPAYLLVLQLGLKLHSRRPSCL